MVTLRQARSTQPPLVHLADPSIEDRFIGALLNS
jgi:hypothetical protein